MQERTVNHIPLQAAYRLKMSGNTFSKGNNRWNSDERKIIAGCNSLVNICESYQLFVHN